MMYAKEVKAVSQYTTGELAKLCGVSIRTVQYYDNRGILIPNELSSGGRRLYSEEDVKRLKIICFLRELNIPLGTIAELMKTDNSAEVISMILREQERLIKAELDEKQKKLQNLESVNRIIEKQPLFSVESIGDVANIMENKKKLRKIHITLLLMGLPFTLMEWISIILWIVSGIWWPFVAYTVLAIPFAIWISSYYFKRVSYICPNCHEVFRPDIKEAFFAAHTPTTRKLTCKHCGYHGYCVETYSKEDA